MSILINHNTKVVIQGITGKQGRFHCKSMVDYGTNVVAGVTPGKGGMYCDEIPVFNTLREAKEQTEADASIIFVPGKYAADCIIEAVESNISLCVCITEGIPVHDMIRVKSIINNSNTILLGPNCPGLITPDECKVGIIPGNICKRGCVGIVSRSGTLTYEAINQLSERNIGQSTAIGIGGDGIRGISFTEILEQFYNDEETKACVLIGEIGGYSEQEAAIWISQHEDFPVTFYISGVNAPLGKRMGHAGAIIEGNNGRATIKIEALINAGAYNAITADKIGETVSKMLQDYSIYS